YALRPVLAATEEPDPAEPVPPAATAAGDRLRVALITETFLPKVDGVVTRLVATLHALERLGHEVLVLAPPGAPGSSAGARVVAASGLPFPWYPEHTIALPSARLG